MLLFSKPVVSVEIKDMYCPSCSGVLQEVSVPPVMVDVCVQGCKGIWFDRGELEKVLKKSPDVDQLMNSTGWEVKDPIVGAHRACPRCVGIGLKTFQWGTQYPVELDVCPGCGGYWLDAGELLLVSEQMKQGEKLPEVKPVLKPGVSLESREYSTGEILAWEVASDVAQTALWYGPDLIHAGVQVADALPAAGDILPAAGEVLLSSPGAVMEGAAAVMEGAGSMVSGLAEGAGAVAEGAGAVAEGLGDLVGGFFELLGGLFN
jgi:Zn-finger nucleic acid-binding protein